MSDEYVNGEVIDDVFDVGDEIWGIELIKLLLLLFPSVFGVFEGVGVKSSSSSLFEFDLLRLKEEGGENDEDDLSGVLLKKEVEEVEFWWKFSDGVVWIAASRFIEESPLSDELKLGSSWSIFKLWLGYKDN